MVRGEYLSLEEARKAGQIDQFCKEHPSEGDWDVFDTMMDWFTGPWSCDGAFFRPRQYRGAALETPEAEGYSYGLLPHCRVL